MLIGKVKNVEHFLFLSRFNPSQQLNPMKLLPSPPSVGWEREPEGSEQENL